MDNRPLPYQAIGPYVLFRKLEEGHLADLWRGAALAGPSRGEPVAIHRFKAGDAVALRNAAGSARERLRETAGATIVRDQATEAVGSTTLLIHEYSGGRSLRGIVERASRPASPHPIPVDQAIAIAERISASLQALHGFRAGGARLVHGAVIPQFVWITEDGEIRLAGQHLASGVIASVKDPRVRGEIGGFLAPEIHAGGEPSVAGDVFSVGAILHLTLTGKLPAPQTTAEGLASALDAATVQFDDEPFPPELRAILERTLAPEPAQRFSSFDELHQTLTRLATGGEYAPTTFNLAFFLHTLMKKEREEETEERRREQAA
ncbi:MAG TPA: protein kinase, partial [Thermoanaerobaculia bacterium]